MGFTCIGPKWPATQRQSLICFLLRVVVITAVVVVRTIRNSELSHQPISPSVRYRSAMSVRVEVVVAGDGKTFPQQGQFVSLHYDGFLSNGKKFDSTRQRSRPFKFRYKSNEVIKGFDEAVGQMSLGERSKVFMPASFAFGERGLPGLIPSNEPLVFDAELIGIH